MKEEIRKMFNRRVYHNRQDVILFFSFLRFLFRFMVFTSRRWPAPFSRFGLELRVFVVRPVRPVLCRKNEFRVRFGFRAV